MAENQWLAFEILMIVYLTSAAPVEEADSGGITSLSQMKLTEDDLSTSNRNIDEYETYRQKKAEQGFTSLCWTESLIITEDKKSNTKNMSKAYSIILESMADPGENKRENQNTSCYKIEGDDDVKTERIFKFTTVKETDAYSIKEHKTLFCGAGPVLSEHFIVWPKLNRKQIEIKISPMTSTKWRPCEENTDEDSDRLGSALSLEDSSILEKLEEQDTESGDVMDESPLDSTKSSFDWNNSSSLNWIVTSIVGVKNSSSLSRETTANKTSNKTTNHDGHDSSTESLWDDTGNSRIGSDSSPQLTNVTAAHDVTKEASGEKYEAVKSGERSGHSVGQSQLHVTQNPVNRDNEESVGSPNLQETKKLTKKDTVNNQKSQREYTTENPMEASGIQEKEEARELSNSLLNRKGNCISKNKSICSEIMTGSSLIAEFQNTSSATLANLFFPANTLLQFFRDAGNRSYVLNAKVALELRSSDSNGKTEYENGAYLELVEQSKYQILKNRD